MGNFNSKFNLDDSMTMEKEMVKSNKKEDKKAKYCRKCGTENSLASKFCCECGNSKFYDTYAEYEEVKNTKYCVSCKSKVTVKIKFCPNCGKNQFVSSKEELEKYAVDNFNNTWKKKIEEAENELYDLEKKNSLLKNENKELVRDYNNKLSYYQDKIGYIEKDIKNIESHYSSQNDELVKKINELKSRKQLLQDEYFNFDTKKEETIRNLTKDISNVSLDIQKINEEISSLQSEFSEKEKILSDLKNNKISSTNVSVKTSTNAVSIKKADKNHIYFGTFNGEAIYWNILDESSTNMVLITNQCLDAVTRVVDKYLDDWMTSFYKNSFTAEEKKYLLPLSNSTWKYVGLLSHENVIYYMRLKEKRLCGYNGIAAKKANLRNGLISWWLKEREVINGKGDFNNTVSSSSCHGIRPVIILSKKL